MKKPPAKIRAVIFDMDGVITNTMSYHFDAWFKSFSDVGIKVDCYDVYEREGQDGFSTIKEIFKEHKKKFDATDAKKLLSKKEKLFKKIVHIRFIKGAIPFLKYLKSKGYLLGLVTGTSRHEAKKILPSRIFTLFNVSVTGDEVRRGKPYPEPFIKARKELNINKHELIVIENAPFGIKSAKRAGLYCVAIETSLKKRYLREADLIVHSFKALKAKIFN